ncbi:hypothetical protein FNH22_09535 [Fulvivirga sp. M361]|nr:hypothetical protein [Fulvivirga sp. M361]TRX59612.1 hypothetical protein FNH22_09535 [Fulvivirga sp. M361]
MIDFSKDRTRESRSAIERLYINMRHLFIRGSYKPMGISGKSLIDALLVLEPEIYGSIKDPVKIELDGLLYVMERLPDGIEECQFIKLVSREGFEEAGYVPIIPIKRRRNCFRIDKNRMYIEMTRGRSDIYDILTHLTFLYIESEKIKNKALDQKGRISQDWLKLEEVVVMEENNEDFDEKKATVYLSNFLGRTIQETQEGVLKFQNGNNKHSLYHIIYWLGKVSIEEAQQQRQREVTFSEQLKDSVGQHIYGGQWAGKIKAFLLEKAWSQRPIHIISANLHSILNSIYGFAALPDHTFSSIEELAVETSQDSEKKLQPRIREYALQHGMYEIKDDTGTNLQVQIFDLDAVDQDDLSPELKNSKLAGEKPVLIVMDYAFGEQAFECMDELLKPLETSVSTLFNIKSISIVGKAGILTGDKGDIMIPTAHVFEGTADNYPLHNDFASEDFVQDDYQVYEGPMITVLGTSLQNKDVLNHFVTSTWNAIGLEMEGAHYQKAIQSAARIRLSIDKNVKVRYAYYASDNPLKTGSTLASGSLGMEGIGPTYLISIKVLQKILAGS